MKRLLHIIALCASAATCAAQIVGTGNIVVTGNQVAQVGSIITVPADFFVSPISGAHGSCSVNGSDANTGVDISHPVATLDKARQLVRPLLGSKPITVMKCGGDYFGSSTVFGSGDSGTAVNPVNYTNYPGDTPVLYGGTKITGGWSVVTTGTCATATGNGLTCYQKTFSVATPNFEQLYYQVGSGQLTRRFRPRMGATAGNLVGVYGHSNGATAGNQGFTYCTSVGTCGSNDPIVNWASCSNGLNDCEFIAFDRWTAQIQRISSISTAAKTITSSCSSACPPNVGNQPIYQQSQRYLIENVKELFQFQGQWFLDRTGNPWVLSYIANPGENPNTDTVIIPANNQVLNISGLQFVTFAGLWVRVDNTVTPAQGYVSTQLDPNLTNALVPCAGCVNVTFSGNKFGPTTTNGLRITGASKNLTITGNEWDDIGGYALQLGLHQSLSGSTDATNPNNITVTQNWFNGAGRLFASGDCLMFGIANTLTIQHNDIGYCYDKGIEDCMPSSHTCSRGTATDHDHLISNNDIHNIGLGVMTDLAGFYSSTETGTNNVFTNNRVHDVNGAAVQSPNEPDLGVHGVYIDDQTGLWTISNNVVYRAIGNLVHMNAGPLLANQQNVITNNILANFGAVPAANGGCVGIANPTTSILSFTFTHNICINDVASHTLVNQGQGPENTNSAASQTFTQNLYSFSGTPRFNVHTIGTNVTFATWKATYSQDTAGTISTSPGFVAANGCSSTVPQPLICDDFTFGNGVGPGFGFVYSPQTYGPTVRITVPTLAPTYPEATVPVSSF